MDLSQVSIDSTTARRPGQRRRLRRREGGDAEADPEREERRRVRLRRKLRRKLRLKAALLGRSRGGQTSKVHLAAEGARPGRPVSHDAALYKERNTVERPIKKLKAWRGIATR
ncbi:hypothetical protein GCM10027259_25680 [Micromonospora palomenae]